MHSILVGSMVLMEETRGQGSERLLRVDSSHVIGLVKRVGSSPKVGARLTWQPHHRRCVETFGLRMVGFVAVLTISINTISVTEG